MNSKSGSISAMRLEDVNSDTLILIASFLTKSSKAILATALTAPVVSWISGLESEERVPCQSGKAVLLSVKPVPDDWTEEWDDAQRKSPWATVGSEPGRIATMLVEDWGTGGGRSIHDNGDGDIEWRRKNHQGMRLSSYREILKKKLSESYQGMNDDPWAIVDFIDLEFSLASRLDDDMMCAILMCLGSRDRVRCLRMTNCYGVTGECIESLCGSMEIREIDMTTCTNMGYHANYNSPYHEESLYREPQCETKVVFETVMTAVGKILDVGGCPLERVLFEYEDMFDSSMSGIIPASEGLKSVVMKHNGVVDDGGCCRFNLGTTDVAEYRRKEYGT